MSTIGDPLCIIIIFKHLICSIWLQQTICSASLTVNHFLHFSTEGKAMLIVYVFFSRCSEQQLQLLWPALSWPSTGLHFVDIIFVVCRALLHSAVARWQHLLIFWFPLPTPRSSHAHGTNFDYRYNLSADWLKVLLFLSEAYYHYRLHCGKTRLTLRNGSLKAFILLLTLLESPFQHHLFDLFAFSLLVSKQQFN